MKRSVELDTGEISDQLTKVRSRLHIARLACEGLATNDGGGKLIANMILEIELELKHISAKLCTPSCDGEIDNIRRQVEVSIADLIKDRHEARPEEAENVVPRAPASASNGSNGKQRLIN